jgi:hypothetical protein
MWLFLNVVQKALWSVDSQNKYFEKLKEGRESKSPNDYFESQKLDVQQETQ